MSLSSRRLLQRKSDNMILEAAYTGAVLGSEQIGFLFIWQVKTVFWKWRARNHDWGDFKSQRSGETFTYFEWMCAVIWEWCIACFPQMYFLKCVFVHGSCWKWRKQSSLWNRELSLFLVLRYVLYDFVLEFLTDEATHSVLMFLLKITCWRSVSCFPSAGW